MNTGLIARPLLLCALVACLSVCLLEPTSVMANKTVGASAGETRADNALNLTLSWCPPGTFQMGSPAAEANRVFDEDQVSVTLSRGFWMSQIEMTQARYQEVVGQNPSFFRAPLQPVDNVPFDDAVHFCQRLTVMESEAGRLPAGWEYRLPTEAQWEYACRAGSKSAYPFGADAASLGTHAWYGENAGESTHQAGSKLANAWGLFNMLGNVSEWCRDASNDTLPGGVDPLVTKSFSGRRVHRGGSWASLAKRCRSARRNYFSMGDENGSYHIGFRVALVQTAGVKGPANAFGIALRWCPPGHFTQGSANDKWYHVPAERQTAVTLSNGFWMAETEVTQAQFKRLMGKNPSHFKGDALPAAGVSWGDAVEFCKKLTAQERGRDLQAGWSYRLPTEAQWEYACRAGTTTAYSFGETADDMADHAWISKNAGRKPHAVGTKRANPWGLHDMYGNLAEWCRSTYLQVARGGTDPNPRVRHIAQVVNRGGSYFSGTGHCRSASRAHGLTGRAGVDMGFRVVLVRNSAGDVRSDNALKMKLRWCPPGRFKMGSPTSEARRDTNEVQVDVALTRGFWMGQTEITAKQYRDVVNKSGGVGLKSSSHPANHMSWADAMKFCMTLTARERAAGRLPPGAKYRLPTEAQWEYACRAGTATAYSFGDDDSRAQEYGWFDDPSTPGAPDDARAVGLLSPNHWGLQDMHGNVWEWCTDAYQSALPGGLDPLRSIGTASGSHRETRVTRGGSVYYKAHTARSASRRGWRKRSALVGFRVVLVEDPARTPDFMNDLEMRFKWCPPGGFRMGSPKTEPHHSPNEDQVGVVFPQGFWMGKIEVTCAQYLRLMPSPPAGCTSGRPIASITWWEATNFCQKLTLAARGKGLPSNWVYRLPTEAQWEYAARAGATTAYSFGGDSSDLGAYAWFGDNSGGTSLPGAHKEPNAWGLFDMHGNLSEFCRDYYGKKLPGGSNPESSQATQTGYRIGRGGSFWSKNVTNDRIALRDAVEADDRSNTYGFRVVLVKLGN